MKLMKYIGIGRGELNPYHYIHFLSYVTLPLFSMYWCATHFDFEHLFVLYIVVIIAGINISLFVHRCWSHRSWRPTKRWLQILGLLTYTIQFNGGHITWAATHRKHHRLEDTPEDPHSPYYMPRWKVVLCPKIEPDITYVKDLLQDPVHLFFFRKYWHINIAWWILLLIVNPAYLAFWFAFIGIGGLKMRLINSIGHADPANQSTNNRPIWAYIYLDGEPWHDNHSKDPREWTFSKHWWQIDLTANIIKTFERLGWAKINYSLYR